MASNSRPGITIQKPKTGRTIPNNPATMSSRPMGIRTQREEGLRNQAMTRAAQPGTLPCQRSR